MTNSLVTEIDRDLHPEVLVNELIPGIVKPRRSDTRLDPVDVQLPARFVANLSTNDPTEKSLPVSSLGYQRLVRIAYRQRYDSPRVGTSI